MKRKYPYDAKRILHVDWPGTSEGVLRLVLRALEAEPSYFRAIRIDSEPPLSNTETRALLSTVYALAQVKIVFARMWEHAKNHYQESGLLPAPPQYVIGSYSKQAYLSGWIGESMFTGTKRIYIHQNAAIELMGCYDIAPTVVYGPRHDNEEKQKNLTLLHLYILRSHHFENYRCGVCTLMGVMRARGLPPEILAKIMGYLRPEELMPMLCLPRLKYFNRDREIPGIDEIY